MTYLKLPKVHLTNGIRAAIASAAEYLGSSSFTELFEVVGKSDFLCGKGENGWKANIGWVLKP